jgi:hypothetical protein
MNLIEALESGREDFLDAVRGVTETAATTKPSPERWSVLECAEHVVTVEERFIGWLETGSAAVTAADPANENRLITMLSDRTSKVSAPEVVIPRGRFRSLDEAVSAFAATRDRSMRIVKELEPTLYSIGAKHARLGDVNGVEIVHLMTGHARRHAMQIRETRAAISG